MAELNDLLCAECGTTSEVLCRYYVLNNGDMVCSKDCMKKIRSCILR